MSGMKCCALIGLFVLTGAVGCSDPSAVQWMGTWSAARLGEPGSALPGSGTDLTLRQIVHVSAGGTTERIIFSNEFGSGG